MPNRCSVPWCKGNYKTGPRVSIFCFPSDPQLRQKWIDILTRLAPDNNFHVYKNSRVCELHFQESDFQRESSATDPKTGITITCKLDKIRLKKNALPSVFPVFDVKLRRRKNSSNESAPSRKCLPMKKRSSRTQGKVQGTVDKRRTGKICHKDSLTEILNHSSANSNSKHTEKYAFATTNKSSVFPAEVVLKVEQPDQEEEIVEDICDKGKEITESGQESQEEKNDAASSTMERLVAPVILTPNKISKREEVFGRFVACEMSYLCENPTLYLKVQQNILRTLVEAQFELISSEL